MVNRSPSFFLQKFRKSLLLSDLRKKIRFDGWSERNAVMVSIQLRVVGMWKAECCVRLGGVNRSTPHTRWTVNLLLRESPCSDGFSITFTRGLFQTLTLEQADSSPC